MEPGSKLMEFVAKNGATIELRIPDTSLTEQYLMFINELVEEDAPIKLNVPQDYASEARYLANKISNIIAGDEIAIAAFDKGKLVADASIIRNFGREKEAGTLGIAISKGYRNIGIGRMIIDQLLTLAQKSNFRLVVLDVYSNNPGAIHLYKKLGFQEAGATPKIARFGDEYFDSIRMFKVL